MVYRFTLTMRSFWFDPYLWIHLAGFAALPLFLEGCLIGFAVGDPLLPAWLELLLVAVAGSAPLLWMQWQRPFYIFSLVAVTVKPEKLTDEQRRLLTLFKSQRNRLLAALVPVLLTVLLWKLYEIAPLATPAISFLPGWRLLGLLLATVAFLACNLFVQVPVSVASVMLTSETAFVATPPHVLESIRRSFTLVGLQLNQLLPPVSPALKPALVVAEPTVATIDSSQIDSKPDSLVNDLWAEASAPPIEASVTDSSTAALVSNRDIPDGLKASPSETPAPEASELQ